MDISETNIIKKKGETKMPSQNDKFAELIDFLSIMDKPVELDEVLQKTELSSKKTVRDQAIDIIKISPDVIIDKKMIVPKSYFLKDVPVRVQPTDFEIENNILIPGHRTMPFLNSNMPCDEIELIYKKRSIGSYEKKISSNEACIYFSLLDIMDIPVDDPELLYDPQDNKDIEVTVYDMSDIYKENNFKRGDTFIFKPVNLNEGIFEIVCDSTENQLRTRDKIQKADDIFYNALCEVVKLKKENANIEKQLLHVYYKIHESIKDVPPTAFGPMLAAWEEITFSILSYGTKILHFKNDIIDEEDSLPDLTEPFERYDEEDYDLETIDGILKYIGNGNSEIVVRALLLQQIVLGKRDYEPAIEYLFHDMDSVFFPEELEERFVKLVSELYDSLLADFGDKTPSLSVQAARKKILSLNLKITEYLRKLDKLETSLEDIPKKEFHDLGNITGMLDDVLIILENIQHEGEEHDEELEGVNKGLKHIETELPAYISAVDAKIKENINRKKHGRGDEDEKDNIIVFQSKQEFRNVYQLKITLKGIKPPVWRRILVPENYTFYDLHFAIQSAMGWYHCHLHEFIFNRDKYDQFSIGDPENDEFGYSEIIDERAVRLFEYLTDEKQRFDYIYDFGDDWEHAVVVEKILPRDQNAEYPVCFAGKRACPPEDCGGVWGYEELLEVISDPGHEEYDEMIEWLGGEFDPEEFDPDAVRWLDKKFF